MERHEFIVGSSEQGLRLDTFLAGRVLSVSRSQAKRLVEEGHVQIGSTRAAKVSRKLQEGDVVILEVPPAIPYGVEPENIPLVVVYEDEAILVVDKPPGMVVHPAAGISRGTLVNAILHHCDNLSGIGGVLRPGIVHRLDKGTSGLLVVAKSDEAHRALADQFKERQVQKTYRALVWGNVTKDEGLIDIPVGRHPVERKRMSTASPRGREARTRWMVSERYGLATLLDVDLETGRTHQIRVHLASLGHPVVGDSVYGGTKKARTLSESILRAKLLAMKRQALHAARLCFAHPISRAEMAFASPLPDDMAALCNFLRNRVTESG